MSFVYILENKITGHVYVGKAKNPACRWRKHKRDAEVLGSELHLHRAIRKHGSETFQQHIIEEFSEDSEAYAAEAFFISYLRTIGATLYNENSGGVGGSPSIEVRQKISRARKSFRHSDETKEKMSKSRKGRKLSLEHRQHMSEARKGKRISFHTRNRQKGILHSDETKRKISEAARDRWARIRRTKEELN